MSLIATIPPFITAILVFNLMLILVATKDREGLGLIPLCLATIWWHAGWAISFSSNVSDYFSAAKITHIGILYLPVALIWFSPLRHNFRVVLFSHFIYLILLGLLRYDLIISSVREFDYGYYAIAGTFHPVFMIFITTIVFMVIRSLFSEMKQTKNKYKRLHNKILILCTSIFCLSSIDFFQNYQILDFYPIGFIFSIIFIAITTFSILRLHLFRNDEVIDKLKLELLEKEKFEMLQKNAVDKAIAGTVRRISHDLKSPFQIIKSLVDAAIMDKDPKKLLLKLKPHVDKNIDYVDNLIQNILFSQSKFNKKSYDLLEIVKESWLILNAADSRFILDTSECFNVFVNVSKNEMIRVFVNILRNAQQAMPSKCKKQWIQFKKSNELGIPSLKIVIGNEGTFISEEDQEQLFNPLFSKHKKDGMGLGLAICSEIVGKHNGKIWCQSSKNKGTEFVLVIPLD